MNQIDPLVPAIVKVDDFALALHRAPGLEGELSSDLNVLSQADVGAVITLLTGEEIDSIGVSGLGEAVAKAGMQWYHLPVKDKSLPDDKFEQSWEDVLPGLHKMLADGKVVSIHCRGGTGRTGLVAAKLLLSGGTDFDKAVEMVRAARPGALTAESQLMYLKAA